MHIVTASSVAASLLAAKVLKGLMAQQAASHGALDSSANEGLVVRRPNLWVGYMHYNHAQQPHMHLTLQY